MKKQKLGDYVNIRTGKLDANASSACGAYPFFTCAIEPLKIDTFSYDCECVLVAGNGDLNVKYYSGKFDAYQRTYIIESKDKKILAVPYLYRFLDNYVAILRSQSIGGVIKYIKLGNLTGAELSIPSIAVQNKIVGVLCRLDNLISAANLLLAKLDELVKAKFVEMFGEVGVDKFGWGFKKLSECCVLNPSKRNDIDDNVKVSFIGMTNVTIDGVIDVSVERNYKEVKKGYTYFEENDVLFAKITPCMENGKGAVARNLRNALGAGSTEFHVLRPIPNKSIAIWIYTVLSFKKLRLAAECKMTGSAGQRRVPERFFEQFDVALPPIELQNQFADYVCKVDGIKDNVRKSLNNLETLKKSLMQEYFG